LQVPRLGKGTNKTRGVNKMINGIDILLLLIIGYLIRANKKEKHKTNIWRKSALDLNKSINDK